MPERTDFFDQIQYITESCLTRRKRVRRIKKEKRKAKNPIIDWIEAFIWAAGMVLLINQYLVQAYRIPSGSMIESLNIGDHVFVNKLVYGPELLPGILKLPSPIKPKRNDIIIFENPSYISNGPVFDITQRIIYMLTLSIVDIDRDKTGDPRVHFLIKRAAGSAGDHFIIQNGNMQVLYAGETTWIKEQDYNAKRGYKHKINRLITDEQYPQIEASGKVSALYDINLPAADNLISMASQTRNMQAFDSLARDRARLKILRMANPGDRRYNMLLAKDELGWYVPEGRILPLGDNRDNSRDGRFFGPVKKSKVLGKGMIIYWPYWRAGIIK